jgi:hypothetical protein
VSLDWLRQARLGGFERRHGVAMRAQQDRQPPADVRVVVNDDEFQDGPPEAPACYRQQGVTRTALLVE